MAMTMTLTEWDAMLQQDLEVSNILRDRVPQEASTAPDLALVRLDPMEPWPPWLHAVMLESTATLYEVQRALAPWPPWLDAVMRQRAATSAQQR